MNFGFWIRRPGLVPARIFYWLWERMNPDKPWLCRGAITYCETHLTKSMVCVEFGSGRSTVWFAERVRHLTSIEHDGRWYEQVGEALAHADATNIDYRLIPLDHPAGEPEQPTYSSLPAYVAILHQFADASLDVIVVDGHYRTHCIRASVSKLKPGGLLLVDDVDLWPSRDAVPIPDDWVLVDKSSNGIKHTCIWQRPVA